MKVAIHQPQYLPWFPYLAKIDEADLFIVLDSVDFQKNGLQNRNQIKTSQGASWLTVPIKHRLGQKISEVHIDNNSNWRTKHWRSLFQNYSKAAAYSLYAEELENVYAREWLMLDELNVFMLKMFMRWMNIDTPLLKSSALQSDGRGSDLVLNLCLEVGATSYLSGVGGRNYLDLEAFNKSGVEVAFGSPLLPQLYPQCFNKIGFVDSLSVLDLILNCGKSWRHYMNAEDNK